jgi:hypothetical protein
MTSPASRPPRYNHLSISYGWSPLKVRPDQPLRGTYLPTTTTIDLCRLPSPEPFPPFVLLGDLHPLMRQALSFLFFPWVPWLAMEAITKGEGGGAGWK